MEHRWSTNFKLTRDTANSQIHRWLPAMQLHFCNEGSHNPYSYGMVMMVMKILRETLLLPTALHVTRRMATLTMAATMVLNICLYDGGDGPKSSDDEQNSESSACAPVAASQYC
eukprot:TRINITY_DN96730_c0_g1_i1.p1 TRINITY_DN96730_c0_g1~~TRINITY_DN96730_c0_g1_i1.p1  ORF type:complete len:114 (-),score=3.10 TRINITY_DN96730_c0_g1_i1:180-521(-)